MVYPRAVLCLSLALSASFPAIAVESPQVPANRASICKIAMGGVSSLGNGALALLGLTRFSPETAKALQEKNIANPDAQFVANNFMLSRVREENGEIQSISVEALGTVEGHPQFAYRERGRLEWSYMAPRKPEPEKYREMIEKLFGFVPKLFENGIFRRDFANGWEAHMLLESLGPRNNRDARIDWGDLRYVSLELKLTTSGYYFRITLDPKESATFSAMAKRHLTRAQGALRNFATKPRTPEPLGIKGVALRYHEAVISEKDLPSFMWELDQFYQAAQAAKAAAAAKAPRR